MLKLDELATRAGVSPRTVRYYIQRGVLPAPNFKGPDTAYDERHLHALRAIKRLQEDHLPLDEIASALEGKGVDELKKLADRGADRRAAKVVAKVERSIESKRGERVILAEGIELWIEEGADRALVEQIMTLCKGKAGHS